MNCKKKILFLIESMTAECGGPTLEVANLTKLLLEDPRIEITLCCNTSKEDSFPIDERIKFFQFQNPFFPFFSWIKAVRNLRQLIENHDVIFSTGIWGPVDGFALRLAWKKDKPVFIRICGMLEPYILTKNPIKKRLAMMSYVSNNLKEAKGIIVNSRQEAQGLKKLGLPEQNILIIPNGIEISKRTTKKTEAKRALNINPNKPVLLYLSRIHPKKGLDLLLKALAKVEEDKRHLTLLVAGEFCDESYQNEIENLVKYLDLTDIVCFSGWVGGNQKEIHFDAADCFVLPSHSEGLPNAVLEALSHGLPAIITNGCNIPEIADYEAGLVIDLSVNNLLEIGNKLKNKREFLKFLHFYKLRLL